MSGFWKGALIGGLVGYRQGVRPRAVDASRPRYGRAHEAAQKFTSTPAGNKVAGTIQTAGQKVSAAAEEVMTTVMTKAAGLNREGTKA